jgi:uncharacterized protein (DUF58 family)
VVLLLFLLSLITAISTGTRMYYRFTYFFGLMLAGSWIWSKIALRGLQLVRTARTVRAQVGYIFEERFDLQNQYLIPRLWVEVRDSSNLPGSEGSRVLSMVNGRAGRSYLARTRLVQRGVYPLGPTILASSDLFGLFPVSVQVPSAESLLVYPLMLPVRGFPNPPGLMPGGEALRRKTHQITTNASGVREYVHGDSLNRIHWLSTARRDRLMVKEFELDPLADVWIFLDGAAYVHSGNPRPLMDPKVRDIWQKSVKIKLPASTEEYAVSIAASIARDYLSRSRAVGLVTAGAQLTALPPDRGARQLGKLLEALAILNAKGKMPLRGLVEAQARNLARGSTVVIITTSVARELPVILDYLLMSGLRPVVVLLDDVSFGGQYSLEPLTDQIKALGVPLRLVREGDELEQVLVTPV